ncbi:hypothetical protein AB3S75_027633 [Citrus x aurantiifolia]
MKSGFWQIGIKEDDRHKTAFVVPHGHYEWNVMPFGLKNAPSESQNRMDEVYKSISGFCLIYIDDALISATVRKNMLNTYLNSKP